MKVTSSKVGYFKGQIISIMVPSILPKKERKITILIIF